MMQRLNAGPRSHLTEAQVATLLRSADVDVSAGLELLAPDLSFREDISDDLESGSVGRRMGDRVHGTCRLRLARTLRWGVDLVRPYMVLSDGHVEARWNLGVFALTTPTRPVGDTPVVYDVAGYDRVYLLNRQVGADFTVAAGVTYRQALLNVFAAAGLSGVLIEGSAADATLPKARVWPLVARSTDPDQTNTPVTWLRVVNDLLLEVNFRGVWADEDGAFRCAGYRPPEQRASEWTFDTGRLTILGEERVVAEDVWATPNRWVFRQTNRADGAPPASEGDGIYTVVNQSDGDTSIDARGLTWTSVVDYEAASQAVLVGLGDRNVTADRAVTTRFEVTTGPFPGAGHFDVYQYDDERSRRVQAVEWDMPLDGSDVSWVWEAI